jgi:hypothetical protein
VSIYSVETGKLYLDDLARRIKELRNQQDELSKTRLQLEAEKLTQEIRRVDVDVIKDYTEDL